ncbi:hypothetical protein EBZ80_13780 [bacterium]|nr:hypothetical protein [bacterium]
MNKATFTHTLPKDLHKLVRAWNSGKLMSAFLPCPIELKETVAGSLGRGTPEQAALEIQEQQNLERFGSKNWYDWQVQHWGTKWDIGRDKDSPRINLPANATSVTLRFETAWAPPIAFYDHLRFKCGFLVDALFYEPGVGFCGVYDRGLELSWELPTTQQELDVLPATLVEEFNLQECLRNEDDTEDDDEQEED